MGDDETQARLRSLIEQQPPSDRPGLAGWLDRLCALAVHEIGVSAAAVLAGAPGGDSAVLAATTPDGQRLAEIEFGVGEGPAHDAWQLRRPALIPELGGPHDGAFPGYTTTASAAGIRSVFAFPLQVGIARVGVLQMFSSHHMRLTRTDLNACLQLAELVTQALIDNPIVSSADAYDTTRPGFNAALGSRDEIYQAQGIVAVAQGISILDSLALMRSHAFRTSRDLLDVAHDIVHNGLRPGDANTEPQHDEDQRPRPGEQEED